MCRNNLFPYKLTLTVRSASSAAQAAVSTTGAAQSTSVTTTAEAAAASTVAAVVAQPEELDAVSYGNSLLTITCIIVCH